MKINNPFSKTRFLALLPLILVMILDLVFTLVGQPKGYWQNYEFFNEAGPLGKFFLSLHPVSFVGFLIIYILFVLFFVSNLKKPLSIIVYITFFLGHVWGSSSWIPLLFNRFSSLRIDDWYLNIGYFVIIAIITGFCLNKSD
ncbi:MAG: hypothetical protein PHW72_02290 [Candidatus Pacebacteria bacterium]|nr:hypothetical protein [Candidatus Paceibacterota bacterium]